MQSMFLSLFYCDHRYQHSFPTRRSSDLHHCEVGSDNADFVSDEVVDRFCVLGSVDDHRKKLDRLRNAGVTRSEEHTSELQSHSDLVCRLLLEKKNDCRTSSRMPKTPRAS